MINITKPQIDDALIRVESGLNQYLALQAAFGKLDVSKSREFQRKFNHFYRVRRNTEWQSHFYQLLQEKKTEQLTFEEALTTIQQKTGNIEASFASKLVATINPEMPVVDQFVLENVGLKLPYSYANNRVEEILEIYEQLKKRFKAFLETENGKYLVDRFKENLITFIA
jgi:hypothetical protein